MYIPILDFLTLKAIFEKEESILLYEFERHNFPLNGIYQGTSGRPEE